MAMLNGALIGCGFFATNHLNAWRDIGRDTGTARLVALCDRDPERLTAAAAEFGIERTYQDAAEMMAREKLDFVDVCTTPPSHRALVELAAANGIPAICQKPMAPSLADAEAMVEACARAGVPFMVHENFRWESPIMAVREALESGAIGTPYWGRISFRSGYDVYAGQPYLAEGERFIIEDLGVHVLDVARFLFGDVRRLAASTNQVNPNIRGEDAAAMLLTHEEGATSVVDCSYSSRQEVELFPQTLIEVDGSEGSIRLSANYRLAVTSREGTEVRDVSPPVLPWATPPWHVVQESVLLIQKHWVDCLVTGKQPATSGRDNLKTLRLVEASYRSAANGVTVDPGAL
jgi:D-apiose dehydrogenase